MLYLFSLDPYSNQEARILMNNKVDMTMDDLREVLLENEVTNFDPVVEAFKVCRLVMCWSSIPHTSI